MKKVVYLQFTNPGAYPPLIHSSNILLDADWQVLFLGVFPQGNSRNITMPEKQGRETRMLKWVAPGIRQKLHFLRFVLWTIVASIRERADLIYCSDPFSTPSGILLRKMGFRVIYHEHDSPNPSEEDSLPSLIVWARRKLLRDASLVIFPNALRLKRAQSWSGSVASARVVWNCPSKVEVGPDNERVFNDADNNMSPLRLYYHGAIVPGRPPLSILDAISRSEALVQFTLVGYTTVGSVLHDHEILDYAKELGISDRVNIRNAVPREDLLLECSQHDIGLATFSIENSETYIEEMVGASNKPFDYLSQGMLVIVTDTTGWKELLVNAGCALEVNPDDTEALIELFDWLANNRKKVQEMGRKGREMIEREWNYEKQFQPVFEWIDPDKLVVESD